MCKNASDISCILGQRQYIPVYGVLTVSFWLKPFKKSIYMCKNASEISCILAQRLYIYIPVQLFGWSHSSHLLLCYFKRFPIFRFIFLKSLEIVGLLLRGFYVRLAVFHLQAMFYHVFED